MNCWTWLTGEYTQRAAKLHENCPWENSATLPLNACNRSISRSAPVVSQGVV